MASVTSARVLQELESAILSGQFKLWEPLIKMDLIGRFGASRTVIREAFNKLEAKGLIRSAPYRGVVVADLTVKEIEEIYSVRVAVEKMAARLVVENICANEIVALKRMNQDVEDHLRRKTSHMIEKDWESIGPSSARAKTVTYLKGSIIFTPRRTWWPTMPGLFPKGSSKQLWSIGK